MISRVVKNVECRVAHFIPAVNPNDDDYHLVKEVVNYEDNTNEIKLKLVPNFKRPFYITKEYARNHQQKKDFEKLDNLLTFKCRQSDLEQSIKKALKLQWMQQSDLRSLSDDPYLYGTDISSTAIIKQLYLKKYPDASNYYRYAVFDTETDMIWGDGGIIMATFSHKEVCHTVVLERFIEKIPNYKEKIDNAMTKYLGEIVEKRGIKSTLEVASTEFEIIQKIFKVVHEVKPDYLAMWNAIFDIDKMKEAAQKCGGDLGQVMSDPIVPPNNRFFKVKYGPAVKKTESGKELPLKPHERWNKYYCPASYNIVDAMHVYKQLRVGADERSYNLNDVLDRNLGIRKLNFKEAGGLAKADWHIFMQENYPIEYIIYNRFDCISMEMLNEKTNDFSVSVPINLESSDFNDLKSSPKLLADSLHWFFLQRGVVAASGGKHKDKTLDQGLLSIRDWITAAKAALVEDNGLRIIYEDEYIYTNIRIHCAD